MLYFVGPNIYDEKRSIGVFWVDEEKWEYYTDIIKIYKCEISNHVIYCDDRVYIHNNDLLDYHKECREITKDEYDIMSKYFFNNRYLYELDSTVKILEKDGEFRHDRYLDELEKDGKLRDDFDDKYKLLMKYPKIFTEYCEYNGDYFNDIDGWRDDKEFIDSLLKLDIKLTSNLLCIVFPFIDIENYKLDKKQIEDLNDYICNDYLNSTKKYIDMKDQIIKYFLKYRENHNIYFLYLLIIYYDIDRNIIDKYFEVHKIDETCDNRNLVAYLMEDTKHDHIDLIRYLVKDKKSNLYIIFWDGSSLWHSASSLIYKSYLLENKVENVGNIEKKT